MTCTRKWASDWSKMAGIKCVKNKNYHNGYSTWWKRREHCVMEPKLFEKMRTIEQFETGSVQVWWMRRGNNNFAVIYSDASYSVVWTLLFYCKYKLLLHNNMCSGQFPTGNFRFCDYFLACFPVANWSRKGITSSKMYTASGKPFIKIKLHNTLKKFDKLEIA